MQLIKKYLVFLCGVSLSLFAMEQEIMQWSLVYRDLLELSETSEQYSKATDIDLENIVSGHSISMHLLRKENAVYYGSLSAGFESKYTKLVRFFKILKQFFFTNGDKTQALTNTTKKRVYFIREREYIPGEHDTDYGVNPSTLKGRNFVGKMIMKMRDDPEYIERVEQKIDVSEEQVNRLYTYYVNNLKSWYQQSFNPNSKYIVFFYSQGKSLLDQPTLYDPFSDFFSAEIYIDEIIWPTSQHYCAAMQFTNKFAIQKKIIEMTTTKEVFDYVNLQDDAVKRGISKTQNYDREGEKSIIKAIFKALWLKCKQNEELKMLLLNTGTNFLVDKSKDKMYSEMIYSNQNDNVLGLLLMSVREGLRKENQERGMGKNVLIRSKTITGQSEHRNKEFPNSRLDQSNEPGSIYLFFKAIWEWFVSWFS